MQREHADDGDRRDEAAELRSAVSRQLGHQQRHRAGRSHRQPGTVALAGAAMRIVGGQARQRRPTEDDRAERQHGHRGGHRRQRPGQRDEGADRERGEQAGERCMHGERHAREGRAEEDRQSGAPQRTDDSGGGVGAAVLERQPEQRRDRIDRHRRGQAAGARPGLAKRGQQQADGGGGNDGMNEAGGGHGGAGRREVKRTTARASAVAMSEGLSAERAGTS